MFAIIALYSKTDSKVEKKQAIIKMLFPCAALHQHPHTSVHLSPQKTSVFRSAHHKPFPVHVSCFVFASAKKKKKKEKRKTNK